MNRKYYSLISFIVGMILQIFLTIYLGNATLNTVPNENFVNYAPLFCYIAFLYGIYQGVECLVKVRKFEIFCVLGILVNASWVLFFVLAYFLKW